MSALNQVFSIPKPAEENPSRVLALVIANGSPVDLLKPIAGHPVLAYSLAAALKAHWVAHVLVICEPELTDTIFHYQALMNIKAPEIEVISKPAYLHSRSQLEAFAFEQGNQWLSSHADRRIDMLACLFADRPLHPNGSIDQAAKSLREHGKASQLLSVIPTASLHHLWSSDRAGLVSPAVLPASNGGTAELYAETGHFKLVQLGTHAQSKAFVPFILDRQYEVDGLTSYGRDLAQWLIQFSDLDLVYPGRQPRKLPEKVSLLVMDFDGVLSDNRVWVNEQGHEEIAANRSDSLGLAFLHKAGIGSLVISMETNLVVTARCNKMHVPVLQGIMDKATVLKKYMIENDINPAEVVYLGNDVNDLPCFPLVGCAIAVADSHPMVLRRADHILTQKGGHAAVRELCDLLIYQAGFDPTAGL